MSFEVDFIRLRELSIRITKGTTPTKGEGFVECGVNYIKSESITADGTIDSSKFAFIDPVTHEKLLRSQLRAGNVLFSMAGMYLGKTAVVSSEHLPANTNQAVGIITLDESKADPYFIHFSLQSPACRSWVLGSAAQSAQPNFNLQEIGDLKIPAFSLVRQKEIASVLRLLDDRITLLRETNATLEAIAQALFKSWFVDFDPVRAKLEGRTPEGIDETTAALFPDGFEESELGLVPRGWRASNMGEVSTVGIGKTPPRKEPQWFSESAEDMRWVSIRDMGVSGVYASQTSEYLTSEAIQRFNVRVVPDNTTLLSFKMTIGRVAITDGEMTTNEAIAHFKLNQQSPLTSKFIYLHLKQFNYASLSSTSSIADAVNSKTVRNIPVLVPNSEVLGAFQNQVKPLFDRIKVIEQQAQTLATLRDTLLPRLISGALRLPETL